MKLPRYHSCIAVLLLFCSSIASAADLASLDWISVLMPKQEVLAILGKPDKMTDMGGIRVELYLVHDAAPLVSAGLFYEKAQLLAGTSLIFKGDVAAQTIARMKTLGFDVREAKGDYARLIGKDDDTGQPIVVTISRLDELTTVTTFEKGFYERRANQ